MAGFWEKRRARRIGRDWLRHARLCLRMREDVGPAGDIERVRAAERDLAAAVTEGSTAAIDQGCAAVKAAVSAIMPPRPWAGLRENLEVVVVAVAVAMAFRTYFLQPFKIPTGSMQPTLYGIHYTPQRGVTVFDSVPLKYGKWLLFGEWYTEITAPATGRVRGPLAEQGGIALYDVGGIAMQIPRDMTLRVSPGDEVVLGQVLASGNRVFGDHLFVNRVLWNFSSPTRGQVMVFKTDGIQRLDPKTHYIKRLVGLPGETIGIDAPYLVVNGKRVTDPPAIRRVESMAGGYAGYMPATGHGGDYLGSPTQTVHLSARQFLGMGDNTRNSFDGRYWGAVPAENMVGPAWVVYWPLSRRWGAID